jgi:hypothetical protein
MDRSFGAGRRKKVVSKVNDLETTLARKPPHRRRSRRHVSAGRLIVLPADQQTISEAIRR